MALCWQLMNPNDPLTILLVPPAGQIFHITVFRGIAWHLEDVSAQTFVQIFITLDVTSFYSLGFTWDLNLFFMYSTFVKDYVKVLK